jgi:hypothetical protein
MASGGQRAPARTAPSAVIRVFRAWRALSREQRLTAVAALALWLTLFLPWYSESAVVAGKTAIHTGGITLTAWGAFSFVEAAVLLVSIAVLALLFARGERRAFHLPSGDGGVIIVAGAWVALLVIYRMFDKNGSKLVANGAITSGIDWGIFMALFAAIWLAYTGVAMRRAHRAEPRLSDDPTVHLRRRRREPSRERPHQPVAASVRPAYEERPPAPPAEGSHERRAVTREDAEQLSFDLPHDPDDR